MATFYVSFGVPRIEWLLNIHSLGFKDYMATIYACFKVIRTKWLLYIRPLELQGVRSLKHFAKEPLCVETFVEFCTLVRCPCGKLFHYFISRYHEILSCQGIFFHIRLC